MTIYKRDVIYNLKRLIFTFSPTATVFIYLYRLSGSLALFFNFTPEIANPHLICTPFDVGDFQHY